MKLLLPLALLLISAPAFAQAPAADMKERVALATEFHKIRDLKSVIDRYVNAQDQGLSKEGRAKYREDMHRVFDYKKVEEESIQAMAETFTAPELKAMVDYYSKPEGRSAAEKLGDYDAKLTPILQKAMDQAFMDIRFPKK